MKFGGTDNQAGASATVVPHPEMPVVLLIGYGNLLRSDDGVGPAIVSRLAAVFAGNTQCSFLTPHQLTPELAESVACASRVVFVDASVEQAAGEVRIKRVAGEGAISALGHSATPAGIMALSRALYHRAPSAWTIGVGVANLAVGDRLSPAVARAAGRLCRRLTYRVGRWCRPQEQNISQKDATHVCT